MNQTLRGNWLRASLAIAGPVLIVSLVQQAKGVPFAQIPNGQVADLPEPQFVSGSLMLTSDNNEAVVFVKLPTPAPGPVTVDYVTKDGSAKAGVDYVAGTGTVTFPAGSQVQAIHVPLMANAAAKSGRTLSVSLGNGASPVQVHIAPVMHPNVTCFYGPDGELLCCH